MLNHVSKTRTDTQNNDDMKNVVTLFGRTGSSSLSNIRQQQFGTNNYADNYQILSNTDDSTQLCAKCSCHLTMENTMERCNETLRLKLSAATCAQLSKLTTISETSRKSFSQQQCHTKPTKVTTIKRATENLNVKSNANVNANVKSSNKSTTTENKYLSTQLTVVSTEQELKVYAAIARPKIEPFYGNSIQTGIDCTNNCQLSSRDLYARTESVEYEQGLQTGLQLSQRKELSELAERKAQLKADFFADQVESKISGVSKFKTLENSKNKSGNYLLKRLLQDKARNWKSKNIIEKCLHEESEPTSLKERKLNLQNKLIKDTQFNPIKTQPDCTYFPKVRNLVHKFNNQSSVQRQQKEKQTMIVNNSDNTTIYRLKPDQLQSQQQHRHSPLSDEGCNLTQSPYCSSDEDNDSICTASTAIERPSLCLVNNQRKEKVARSPSSDSALGLDVDESVATPPLEGQYTKRRMTLTVTDLPLRPALLPLAEPTALPDSILPTELQQSLQSLMAQTAIPSKVLLEERVVELPVEEPINSRTESRRESAQSCISDYQLSECSGVRYMRTPSVVVSDYSDDVMCGITLEEIEYFRAQRSRRRCSSFDTTGTEKDAEPHSDISAASSCSNLYYCGSTISALDGAECYINGTRVPLERNSSDSSNNSVVCECEEATPTLDTDLDLTNLLVAQHLDNKIASVKKVGLTPKVVVSSADN